MTLDRDKLAKILGLLGSDKTGEILSAAQAAVALTRNANTSWAEVLKRNPVADDARAAHADNEARKMLAEYEYKMLALGAKNDSLRNMVRQLVVENNSLRRELAACHRNSAPHTQRVVVHGLIAAGIASALGIVAFLSLQGVAVLGGPSVLSGTAASSGQEAPDATARSGEPRAARQQSSAAMVIPAAIPQPPASNVVLAPVEDMTTLSATLPPAIATPDQTARTPEPPPPAISSVPAEEQAAPPTTSPTTSPPPTQSAPNQRLSAAEMAALVTRGDDFLSAGDIVSARLFYERAADEGDRGAALRLAVTRPRFPGLDRYSRYFGRPSSGLVLVSPRC